MPINDSMGTLLVMFSATIVLLLSFVMSEPLALSGCDENSYKRINTTKLLQYFDEQYSDKKDLVISGWLPRGNLVATLGMLRAQTRACIIGSVGEIGVHHGRHLIPITLSALPEEPSIGIDVFEQQHLNYDGSGLGDKSAVKINLHRYGLSDERVRLMLADSTKVTPNDLWKAGMAKFRFFSVDGGHSYETTMSDLKLAASVLVPGGIIAVDDIPSLWAFPGVFEAFYDFLAQNRSIAPFMQSCQKFYLTTADYHARWLKFAEDALPAQCFSKVGFHPSRYSFRNWSVCVKAGEHCHRIDLKELKWDDMKLPQPASNNQ